MSDSPVQTIRVPFAAWYGDHDLALTFPNAWEVYRADPVDAAEILDSQIASAYDHPLGTPTIRQLAQGKKTVAIAVDDLTRPTPVHRFLPQLVDRLLQCGFASPNIRIIIGTA